MSSINLRNIKFNSSSNIDEFFSKFNSGGFVPWFNGNRRDFTKSGRPLNEISDRSNWQKFWNLIPLLFDKEDINLVEFLTLNNIVCVETGSKFTPRLERVGSSGHPGIAYAFDTIKGLKTSYNLLSGNKTALELFNDPKYIEVHGNKPLSNLLINTTDQRWGSDSFPLGFSGNSNKEVSSDGIPNGFIYEADFMKFRGRGFIQSTGRTKYNDILKFIKSYKGNNNIINEYKNKWGNISENEALTISSNRDWDRLFQETDLIIPSFAVSNFSKSRNNLFHINVSSDRTINEGTFNAGWRTNGAKKYGDDIKKIVNTQLNKLSIIPEEPSEGQGSSLSSPTQTPIGNLRDNSDGNDSIISEYPNDLPKVVGLNNFFKPKIQLTPVSFEMPTDEVTKKELSSTLGYQPFVWYLGYQLDTIRSFTLSSKGLLPTVQVVFRDTLGIIDDDGFPLDNTTFTVFLNSRTKSLRPIFMEFKVTSFSTNIVENLYSMEGVCNVDKFFLREYESYSNMSSFECVKEFAKSANMGFNSNISESDDRMNWLNPGMSGQEFIKEVIRSSYRSDESFIWCYVDFYYNINYIDVEEAFKIDITNQKGVKNTGIETVVDKGNTKEDTYDLFLTSDPAMDQSNIYFNDYKIINNSTAISLKSGYLTKSKFYDINDKNYLIFDIDSITTEGDRSIILKGSPQDTEFFRNHVENIYVGKLDSDNIHSNFNYSIIQNKRNITDIQKVGVVIKLNNVNFNLYRYQKIKVFFVGNSSTPSDSMLNERLSGEWLIVDISFSFKYDDKLRQTITLVKRELSLSADELSRESGRKPINSEEGGNNPNPTTEELEIDTTGDVIEVSPDNELIPFDYELEFSNASEIDDFFDQYNVDEFIGWFNKEFGTDSDFSNLPTQFSLVGDPEDGEGDNFEIIPSDESGELVSEPIDRRNWTKFWDNAISLVYNDNRNRENFQINKSTFNIIEFLTLNTFVFLYNGNKFKSITDNRTIPTIFRENNNLDGNKNSLELFNNENYIGVNSNKKYANLLTNTTDNSWSGDVFPIGFSGLTASSDLEKEIRKENNEFITNSDFYKFRKRGYLNFKGRHDYGVVVSFIKNTNLNNPIINKYKDKWSDIDNIDKLLDITKDSEWEELFSDVDLLVPIVGLGNILFDLQSVHIFDTNRSEDKIFKSIKNFAKLVKIKIDAKDDFEEKFVRMVRKQIDWLNSKELVEKKGNKNPEAIKPKPSDISMYKEGGEFDSFNRGKLIGKESTVVFTSHRGSAVIVSKKVAPYLKTLLENAKQDGIRYAITSAFRTNEDQIVNGNRKSGQNFLYDIWVHKKQNKHYTFDGHKPNDPPLTRHGNPAAKPGTSNHQNGIAVDFSPTKQGTDGYKWMVENAWKYGFVRTVKSERWHWEFRPGARMFDYVPQDHETWDNLPIKFGYI